MKKIFTRALIVGALLLSGLPTVALADGEWGVVTVGPADAQNCTATTLKDALEAAARPEYLDEIWIARTASPNFFEGTVTLENRTIKIVGGFDDCEDITPSGFQVMDGSRGSATESVIKIRGISVVTLEHLDIRGGDETVADNGGGIDFDGHGRLNLSHVRIDQNRAGNGGGIYLNGQSSGLGIRFNIGDNVEISDNVAYKNGGGIYMTGAVIATIQGTPFAVHRNTAEGIPVGNGFNEGRGGGIFVRAPAQLQLDAAPFSDQFADYPIFWKNSAVRGGALVATGRDGENLPAQIRLQSRNTLKPLVFGDNRAREYGGAIYIGANDSGSKGKICADDTGFQDNVAAGGAAIYAEQSGGVQGSFTMNACESEAPRCGPGARCSFFKGNRTENVDGQPAGGAVVEFADGGGVLEIQRARFTENTAGNVIKLERHAGNEFRLNNCLIHHNTLSSYVIDTAANSARIRHCTIADNTLAGVFVMSIDESDRGGVPNRSSLTNSIVGEAPNKKTVYRLGLPGGTLFDHVMSNEVATMRGQGADPNTVFQGAGGFQDYEDYVPGPRSAALDRAPDAIKDEASDDAGYDLLNNPRTVDLALGQDETRLRDLGCCELQVLDFETMFKNGFE